VGTIGVILSGAYSLWLYNRIIFGNLRIASTKTFYDLDVREFTILIPLAFLIFFFGLFPSFFLDFMHLFAVSFLIRIPS
jgi:NADH-quinone oxidoreductase subunit M